MPCKKVINYLTEVQLDKPGPAVFPPIAAITWLKKVATDYKKKKNLSH